ncbi:hypothetical protein VZ95_13625 [Elstera litoralis]|uniref:Aldose epimerase n=1 Tax=Elstera litoralis TaxID=552518 RepID=A0A0F3IRC9_9PROT|nr:hypothetical protein [Elstera litoralis]KJV09093.1 hypothetical protein VZ95_13625 [Elstera litoralis]
MTIQTLSLASGALALDLAPQLGGAIVRFQHGEAALFRPLDPSGPQEARLTSCYPLVPFSNRIKEGRFRYGGVSYQAGPTAAGQPHAIHGDGVRRPWDVVAAGPKAATSSISIMGPKAGPSLTALYSISS